LLGRRRRLIGAKRRLLKIVVLPKASQRREAPPFKNDCAAKGSSMVRSAAF